MAEKNIYNLIDETIHQRTRLAILTTLMGVDLMEFNNLKRELNLTDGNLSTHALALERAGHIRIVKSFRGKKPLTELSMTDKGRKAVENYVSLLQKILNKAR
ncbi:MAG: transcriptional regulator [Planctomycetes bacterium]|nr:transcriptional regulator [Planctomycetota bacterium]